MFSDCVHCSPQKGSQQQPLLFHRLLAVAVLALCAIAPARAQCNFNSGSTGVDGAFNPATNQTITLPANGVFNFTTVNIPRGVTIKFTRNASNTPVTILASGSITVVGTLDVSGSPGTQSVFGTGANSGVGAGGPGGFDGGRGGFGFAPFFTGIAGDGPGGGGGGLNNAFGGGGGGFASAGGDSVGGRAGLRYGTRTLVPLIGGSGGGGGGTNNGVVGFGGGGGGGAILLAGSGTITLGDSLGAGSILANGGNPAGGVAPTFPSAGGAGGAIRMVANTITGRIALQVQGGGVSTVNLGGHGYIRVEACSFNSFQPTPLPATTSTGDAIISLASPSSVVFPNAPALSITSIAGIPAPATPAGSFHGTPDIVVPTAQANPVVVALQAANIPLGTVVSVMMVPENGASATVQSTGLAGTVAASTASANINLPASGASLISAQLSFTPAGNRPLKSELLIDGEPVKRVEVAARFGGESEVTYITESGRRIKR